MLDRTARGARTLECTVLLAAAAALGCPGSGDLGIPDDLVTCDQPLAPTQASCGDGEQAPGEVCFAPGR